MTQTKHARYHVLAILMYSDDGQDYINSVRTHLSYDDLTLAKREANELQDSWADQERRFVELYDSHEGREVSFQ